MPSGLEGIVTTQANRKLRLPHNHYNVRSRGFQYNFVFFHVLPRKALMNNLISFILLCLLIINSPLGYLVLIPLDYKYKLELFPWSAKREVTLEELELMIAEFREHHINMDSKSS